MIRSLSLVLVVVALIGVASSIPNLRFSSTEAVDLVVRKLGHVILYLALGLFVSRVVLARWPQVGRGRLAIAGVMLLTAAIAIADEAHQSTVIGREPSGVDVALDSGGALMGVLLHRRSRPNAPRTVERHKVQKERRA
jgi:VanZ family protein